VKEQELIKSTQEDEINLCGLLSFGATFPAEKDERK